MPDPVPDERVQTASVFYNDFNFLVEPGVYEPAEDTFLLADNLDVGGDEEVLELGTGCGILAILAAKAGAKVTATDLNASAIGCAKRNAAKHEVADRIDFRLGNLFEPVAGKLFDLVIFNPPYLPVKREETTNEPIARAWEGGSDGRKIIDSFLEELPSHLKPNGRALFVQSSLANTAKTFRVLDVGGVCGEIAGRKRFFFEELLVIRVKEKI